jgi:hypothetical protein
VKCSCFAWSTSYSAYCATNGSKWQKLSLFGVHACVNAGGLCARQASRLGHPVMPPDANQYWRHQLRSCRVPGQFAHVVSPGLLAFFMVLGFSSRATRGRSLGRLRVWLPKPPALYSSTK